MPICRRRPMALCFFPPLSPSLPTFPPLLLPPLSLLLPMPPPPPLRVASPRSVCAMDELAARCGGGGVSFRLNLSLLSLMLDFGLYATYAPLLNLPLMQSLQQAAGGGDPRQLQVEVANKIYEADRKNTQDSVTRARVEALLFECSHKFLARISQCTRDSSSSSVCSMLTRHIRSTCCSAKCTCRSARSISPSRWTTTNCASMGAIQSTDLYRFTPLQ